MMRMSTNFFSFRSPGFSNDGEGDVATMVGHVGAGTGLDRDQLSAQQSVDHSGIERLGRLFFTIQIAQHLACVCGQGAQRFSGGVIQQSLS
ncbi:hypothetical protein GURKE_02080 [Brevundimonas phage vB_BpoS-Gurke]|uniref:Uncharacterized protein n=1 Tax=Brevundimonas phage vB_BpoS-Gurke TaxID=2948599 RepID=A0A9E7N1P0_9CAUD|nr:hypothetical protein GURKE_02080 [Brevundimonas phage vB_BpoS-Gurke]